MILSQTEQTEDSNIVTNVSLHLKNGSEVVVLGFDGIQLDYTDGETTLTVLEAGSNKEILYKMDEIREVKLTINGRKSIAKPFITEQKKKSVLLIEDGVIGNLRIMKIPILEKESLFFLLDEKNKAIALPTDLHGILSFFMNETCIKQYYSEENIELNENEIKKIINCFTEQTE